MAFGVVWPLYCACAARLMGPSFDHPVGAREESRRDVKTDSFRRLEIDDEFELRRLFDRQFSRFGALQNSIHIFGGPTKLIIPVEAVGDQTSYCCDLGKCMDVGH